MGRMGDRPHRVDPVRFHAGLALLLTLLVALLLMVAVRWSLSPWWHPAAAWLLGVNVVAFGYYGFDKRRGRRNGRRVPEMVLHGLAAVGGCPGAFLGMRAFRHKTVKGRFRLVFWVI